MASSQKLISILFLIALFSMQIHAREFFSKIPSVNNNEKETFIPETTTQKTSSLPNKEEQEPRFIPETQNGYGKETYEPYVTPIKYHPDEPYNSIPATNNNKNGYESTEQQNLGEARFTERGWNTKENQNNNGEKKGMSDTKYLENGRYYYDVKNENNNYYPNQFENSRGVASRNEFNENRYSNMGRYNQNQEEFEESEEEFEP